VVVLRFNSSLNITLSAGLTATSVFLGNERIVTITAGTGTVVFT
jgi:hypothetical protein